MRRLRSLLHDLAHSTRGTAVIETAVVASFLSIVIMGTVDVARYGSALLNVQQGVNRGLEMAMMGGPSTPTATIQSEVATQAGVSTSNVTVTQSQTCAGTTATYGTSCTSGQESRKFYTITATSSFTPTFVGGVLARRFATNGSIAISTTGVIRVT
jgi:Flp pilus assembly protein TadG